MCVYFDTCREEKTVVAVVRELRGMFVALCGWDSAAHHRLHLPLLYHCLLGLVVKVSASTAEDPGFKSRVRQDFSGVESYQ